MAEFTDSPTEDEEEEQKRSRYRLKGYVASKLIRELAIDEKTQVQLAEEYGVAQSTVATFKKKHLARIEEVRENLADEFAGLWIAMKANRIAEYQSDVEVINEKAQKSGATVADSEMIRTKASLLKSVAEELGQLPGRSQVTINTPVVYEIHGLDKDALT